MALKDWIRLERTFPAFRNRKSDEAINILKANDKPIRYVIYYKDGQKKFVDTKSQALKFAKSYMRKH